jgi:CHASE2 domain-containing sensor protein
METARMEDAAGAASPLRSSPYQGLVPYEEADAEWFFGREEWREIVVDNLRAYRVSVLYGESGVGKSSLLRASVLQHLRASAAQAIAKHEAADAIAVVFAEWSLTDPLAALEEAIGDAVAQLAPALAAEPPEGALADVLAAWCDRLGGAVFLVLDQFEELFLYHEDDEAGRGFENELVAALRRTDCAANVLISIREDALAKLDRLQGRLPALLDNLLRLEHLDREAARAAIEQPLDHWNRLRGDTATIEPALVEAVLAQVETGQLLVSGAGGAGRVRAEAGRSRIEAPYLQLVLSRLWTEESRESSSVLRLGTLDRLGGAQTIVHTHLDEVLGTLSRRDRGAAARVFRYLVTPSGSKIAHRPQDLAEYAGVDEARVASVLSTLAGEARILRPVGNDAYEIYHDVLTTAVLDWRRRFEESRGRSALARGRLLAGAAAVSAIVMVAYLGHILGGWEARTVDTRFAIRGAHTPGDVALVAIDDKTFSSLRLRWPFPRRLHARVIDLLHHDGARAIAYDIEFIEPTTVRQDNALVSAVARARNVVLAATEIDHKGHTMIFGGLDLRLVHARPGDANLVVNTNGVVRRMQWGTAGALDPRTGRPGRKLESLPLVAAEVATGRRIPSTALGGETTYIDYAGPAGTIRHYSFSDVLAGRVPAGAFRGKTVIVGAQAPSLQDIHPTPVGQVMSGPEIQANAIETALRGFPLRRRILLDLGLIALLGMIVPLTSLRLGSIAVVAVAIATGGIYIIALQLAFNHSVLLPAVYPLLALALNTALVFGLHSRQARTGRRG